MDNYAIADQFALLSKLMDIHGENAFKSKSYSIAAYNIEQLPAPLADLPREKIAGLKGIGDSTARKIFEILDSGKLSALEEIIRKTPPGVLDMLHIKGLGPKKIATVWKEMGIESIGELLYACQENRLMLYKGFGEKTQQNVKQAIEFFLQHQGQYLYAELSGYHKTITETISAAFPGEAISITGAFRRQELTLDRLEWVTSIPPARLISWLADAGFIVDSQTDEKIECHTPDLSRLVFHLASRNGFGTAQFLTTATDAFLDAWKAESMAVPESALTEADIFSAAGIPIIDPCLREDGRFIKKARQGSLPQLITDKDIRGIIHSHSDWSDGSQSVQDMAKAAMDKGYEYLVISDHSKSAFYARGLTEERIRAQQELIRELNVRLHPFRIFSSIECDILGDGSMDYTDDVLATFDLVIASVHSNLKMTQEKAMQRLLGAIRNPYTTILGHPTGRLLLSREGYPVDHAAMIDACVEHGVVIEINAHPRRLDLHWTWIPEALEKGALLSIDPDAHAVEGYADVHYGILASQKAGLTAKSNLSSFTRAELEAWLDARRESRRH
jgi:DNA polymerase (family 10)